ncbi:cytochrome C oxidase copper chaperone-domain-containing protein [Lentinula detonsa]|uniref:Cytochrome C oxidase copper chaperone-domain-containing protein n=3 Tax=Lentinula TaxID=5352 RepID=A0AA38PR19_9AGAR|nr:cytochrome C oxidase copper chaperone-domain-containing protein [Lentinula detonsa]
MYQKISSLWSSAPETSECQYDPTNPKVNPLNPEGLKPCCACPQTKSARDGCFLKYGPEADENCKELVQNHLACMRSLGFKI